MAKKPFVVLDAEILSSSVWSEALHVRMVWITLLILCDTDGYVGASLPGIASAAGVTLEQAKEAMRRLQEPDEYSRTQTDEGRRVALAERGFRVLNFLEHIDRMSSERAKARDRVRRHRLRKAGNETPRNAAATTVTLPSTQGTGNREQGTENRDKRKERTAVAPLPPPEPKAETWNQAACRTVTNRYGGTAPGGRITKALRPLVGRHGEQAVLAAWTRYLEETEAEYLSPERFATTFAHWSGQARAPAKRAPTRSEHGWKLETPEEQEQARAQYEAFQRQRAEKGGNP